MSKEPLPENLQLLSKVVSGLVILTGLTLIGVGVFMLNDPDQAHLANDARIAVGIGVVILLAVRPLLSYLTKKLEASWDDMIRRNREAEQNKKE